MGLNYGNIKNNFSTAQVYGVKTVGGLVGRNHKTIEKCYSTGLIHSTGDIVYNTGDISGGLVSFNSYGGEVLKSYWNVNSSQQATSSGSNTVYGKTNNQFTLQSTFLYWNFNSIWKMGVIPEINNQTNPYFKRQLETKFISSSSNYLKAMDNKPLHDEYKVGDQITLLAQASTGYEFQEWRLNGITVGQENELSITVTDNANYVAIFNKLPFQFAGGSGTENSPYQIENFTQLEYLSHHDELLDKHFMLIKNIDASSSENHLHQKGFFPIGLDEQSSFTGSFNGNGYIISNLTINRPSYKYVGLFGVTDSSKTIIKHLGLVNVHFTGDKYVGGIVAKANNGSIKNCFVTGDLSGNNTIGGIVAYNFSTVRYSYSTVEINIPEVYRGNYQTGAVIGINSGDVKYCFWDSEYHEYPATLINYHYFGIPTNNFSRKNTFVNWDFENIWQIVSITEIDENPRPYFIQQSIPDGTAHSTMISQSKKIELHPNPTKTFFQLKNTSKNAQLILYSSIGEKLMETNYSGNIIDVSHLAKGIYTVLIKEKGISKTLKLIIQ